MFHGRLKVWHLILVTSSIPFLLALPGCGREESTAEPEPTPDTAPAVDRPPGPVVEVDWEPPAGVDDQDDPDRPRALPKSNEVVGWIKTKPIRLTPPAEFGRLENGSGTAISLDTFRLEKIARCAYESEQVTVDVLLIECATPQDAFGVFGLMTGGASVVVEADKSIRCFDEPSQTYSGWQGKSFVRVQLSEAGSDSEKIREASELLFSRILFSLPTADPPALVQLVGGEHRKGIKLWVVSRTAALKQLPVPEFQRLDTEAMDARLELRGQAWLSVIAIPVGPNEPDNLIWLLESADEDAAVRVYERYQKTLKTPTNRLDSNSMVMKPVGHLVLGTWTAGQESIQNLLPQLNEAMGG